MKLKAYISIVATSAVMVSWSARNILIVLILVAAIAGSLTGLAASMPLRSRSPQTRDLYLFAIDGSFNYTATKDLTSDYYYSSTNIVIGKGDTLIIHFYNPTDQAHTFTMASPYLNDATVAAATNNVIQSATITITAKTVGTFLFHCKFHPPQMAGAIIVQSS